jgi:hypothetical protein
MSGNILNSALTFRLSCWGLGLIAFGQVLIGGVALAIRIEKAREDRVVEKVVTKYVTVAAAQPVEPAKPVVAVAPASALPPPPAPAPLPPARPLAAPPIADPVVERLVQEARTARIASDTASAIIKLGEARATAPNDPNVLYELGLLYEEMAVYDRNLADQAADAYQAVFELGTTGAGALYELAAQKLSVGIAMPDAMRDRLVIGRLIVFPDKAFQDGERTVLTIPVQAAPGAEIDSRDLAVEVNFFDSMMKDGKKEIVPAAKGLCTTDFKWVTGDLDFVGGEEQLRVTYLLPPQDSQQELLFGKRSYYGQVVKIFYKNELIDTLPYPRHLASHSSAAPPTEDQIPQFEQFDSEMPLLPPLDGDVPPVMPDLNSPDGLLPPLPSR